MNLDVDDQKQPSQERIAHDLHPALVVRSAAIRTDDGEWVGENRRGFLEGDPVLAPSRAAPSHEHAASVAVT